VFLLTLSFSLGLVYLIVVPPWQAPDEPAHFEYARLLYEKRRFVDYPDISLELEQEIIASMDRHNFWAKGATDFRPAEQGRLPQSFDEVWAFGTTHELHQGPLAYVLYAATLTLTASRGTETSLYGMRFLSILLGLVTGSLAFLTIRELFPDKEFLLLGVPAFILLLPQHLFTHSVVNNDALAELVTSVLFSILVRVFKYGFSIPRVVTILVLVIVGGFVKKSTLFTIPLVLLATAAYLFWRICHSFFRFSMVAVSLAVVAGGIYLRDRLRDLLIEAFPGIYYNYFGLWRPAGQEPSQLAPLSAQAVAAYRRWILVTFESFWAFFGWMNLRLDLIWYVFLGFVCLTAAGGLALMFSRMLKGRLTLAAWQQMSLLVFCSAVLLALIPMVIRQFRDFMGFPQGRYLFPVIIPLATFFMLGLEQWIPVHHQRLALALCILGLVVVNIVSIIGYIMPFYAT